MEEKLQRILGAQLMRILFLEIELEKAQTRIAELEKQQQTKPDLKVVEPAS